MAGKYQLISAIYEEVSKEVARNKEEWKDFLRTAGFNFKLRFDEQLLIYAQRPDATAVLEIEKWNERFDRWVNKGAKGIAVFDENVNGGQRLRHYFDISDTHEGRRRIEVPTWNMNPEYEREVIEALEAVYGELTGKDTITQAVMAAAENGAEDNFDVYFEVLKEARVGSFLEDLDEDNLSVVFRETIAESVAYLIGTRLDIQFESIDEESFRWLSQFDTKDTLNALGYATSDIAEMGLSEIAKTIRSIERENRTFDKKKEKGYNQENVITAGREKNEDNLYGERRISVSGYRDTEGDGSESGSLGNETEELSERTQEGNVLQSVDFLRSEQPFDGNRGIGAADDGRTDAKNDEAGKTHREDEIGRPDEMGRDDEQHQTISERDSHAGTDLQLEYFDRKTDDRSLPFFNTDKVTKAIRQRFSMEQLVEIENLYQKIEGSAERIRQLKKIFAGTSRKDGDYGWKLYENVLFLYEGDLDKPISGAYYDWGVIESHIEGLIIVGELYHEIKPMDFTFSQEIIDLALTGGSDFENGKFRIYEQFQKSLSQKENVDFLKKEYGVGGSSSIKAGTDIGKDYSGKGIELHRGYMPEAPRILLKWNDVAKRIKELIKTERYLSGKELEEYPKWLEKEEESRSAYQEKQEEKVRIDNAEKLYEYHLGDTVYIGASKYEILEINDDIVRLYDEECPLINQEFEKDIFDKRVRENPANNHLIKTEKKEEDYDEIKAERYRVEHTSGIFKEPFIIRNIAIPYGEENRYYEIDGVYQTYMDEAEAQEAADTLNGLEPDMIKARRLINDFCLREYESGTADFSDLSNIGIAYTETEDYEHEIEVNLNLVDFSLNRSLDGNVFDSRKYENLSEMISSELEYLNFSELTYVSENDLKMVFPDDDEKSYDYLIGEKLTIDGSDFVVENIRDNSVSLKDVSFEKNIGFPINRIEPLEKIAVLVKEAEKEQERLPPPENKITVKKSSFDLHPDVPMAERSNFDLASHEVEEAGKKERFRRNIAAIQLLKKCQDENRFATPDEQIILSKYVGWGGIPEAFDENNSSWTTEYFELKTVLTPDEYASARESTLTAFYTPPEVIAAIYKAMEQMGFKEGNILEPSCGIGNFIGLLPPSMRESKMYGIEIDRISAGIAQQLYQKASIAAQGFEEASLPDSFFDVAVGNVPFGDFKALDRKYDKHNFLIHDYFFAKTIDKVRPGGVIAFVTSKGTMDKANPKVRKYIAQRAELLGAIRLPNNTFTKNAGTEVTSDILFFQKRDRLIDFEPEWVYLDKDNNGIQMNRYFVSHPEMLMGEMKLLSGRFGEESACVPFENADLKELLNDAVANIHGEIEEYEAEEVEAEVFSIPADPDVRNFSFTVVDGTIYFRENSRMYRAEVSETAKNRIKGMITLRESVRRLIELQKENYPDSEIKKEQENLNRLYDTFSEKYGNINSRANNAAFSEDSSYYLLAALEVLDNEGNMIRKADMFSKRTIKPHAPITSVDTSSEALALSIGEKARVDMAYMEELTGKEEVELYETLKGVIFLNPMYEYGSGSESKYLTADEYLSGNVRKKLDVARKSAELYPQDYAANVEALEKIQPKDLMASEINVRLGAVWIPKDIVSDFMFELLSTPGYMRWKIKTHYSEYTGEWNIEGKNNDRGNVKAYKTYGTSRINAYKIIEETLNLKDVRIFDYEIDEEGRRKAILNKKETAIAQGKQELIKQAFTEWIWKDPERRERLTKLYNERFNSVRAREYDGSHIVFSGMNPEITLRKHQVDAIAHILYGGNTLLAHAVGAGKTYEMAAAAMESKRLGLCSKSMFVVPNHLTEQWAAEFLQLYPSANILVATKKDFQRKNRKRFCGKIATGEYDAIIIGHTQFEKIPMSAERQRVILENQLKEIMAGISELKQNRGERFSIKALEKSKKQLKVKLEKLNNQSGKDDVVTFEELGVDRLFIDESHYYKNLYLYTKMRNVGGIAQTEAQKSSDLFMKCRYFDELTGGKGVIFATGTPISNSMVELYTIQRYLQYETLKHNGLQHFDAWASTFGETITAIELAPEGSGYRAKTRFAKFYNLPELMCMFKEIADIKTSDMLNLPVPKANYHNIAVKPSEFQKEMVSELSERADKVRNKMVTPNEDNMLKITNDGRKLALDQRIINDMIPDFEGSKINACVENIFTLWQKYKEQRLAQLVFCDLSTPKGDGSFNVYDDIKKKLIEKGVPENEVRFIHEADSESKKKNLFSKVRQGEVRVLLGSTQKMGAGTNVQTKLIALHDIDCPWRPSDLEQRSGRIIRQGNENSEVEIYRYVTEETFDAYLYQLVESKQKFISQIMTGKSPVRCAEDIDEAALSYAEIKMLATGNPHIKEKMDLDIQVSKLKLLKQNFLSEKYALEDSLIKYYPAEIKRQEERISGLREDFEYLKTQPKTEKENFAGMTVDGVDYTEKAEAGEAIIKACKNMKNPDPVSLGAYRGFNMTLSFDILNREYEIELKNKTRHKTALGSDVFGNITRLDNVLDNIEKKLSVAKEQYENLISQCETAKMEVTKEFPNEDELKEKMKRLDELNILLNMDKRENEILYERDPEPIENDRRDVDIER